MKKLKLYLLSFTLIIVVFFLTIDLYFVYLDFSGQNKKVDYISKVIMSKIDGSYKNVQ
jgi:hypothetical protein